MAGGWQHLVLMPLLPLAFTKSSTRLLTLVGLAYLMSMYALMHYLRYLYPALVLLIPGLLIGLAQMRQQRVGTAVAAVLILGNLACYPNGSWPLYVGVARSLVAEHGNPYQALLKFAPERLLVSSVAPSDRVLIIGRPYLAEHAGRAFTISWYDQALTTRIEPLTGGQTTTEAVGAFLQEFGFTHVMLAKELQVPDMEQHLIAIGAERIRAESDVSLWRLPASLVGSRDLVRERDLAYRLRHRWR
jgi:hypothetical protein